MGYGNWVQGSGLRVSVFSGRTGLANWEDAGLESDYLAVLVTGRWPKVGYTYRSELSAWPR